MTAKIKVTNFVEPEKPVEVEALVDTVAREVLPNPRSPDVPMVDLIVAAVR